LQRRVSFWNRTVVVLLALVAAACGNDGAESSSATTTTSRRGTASVSTTEAPNPGHAVVAYFRALASSDSLAISAAHDSAVLGSPAALYVDYEAWVHLVAYEPHQSIPDQRVMVGADRVALCPPQTTVTKGCTSFTAFQIDPASGDLASFEINGVRIDDRLVDLRTAPDVKDGDMLFDPMVAYESITTSAVSVIVDVSNGTNEPVTVDLGQSTFTGADGRAVAATSWVGPTVIFPIETGHFEVDFETAELPGRLTIAGLSGSASSFKAVIPCEPRT
jgi:hypothetical protein